MSTNVPLVDLRWQHTQIADVVEPKIIEAMNNGAFVGGDEVAQFEQEFAAFCGVDHCVGVANGTDALELAMRVAGVEAGDRVALPANTFIATAEAVVRIGAKPVLVDCDDEYSLLCPESLRGVLARQDVTAVAPVHLYGQLAPMAEIGRIADEFGCVIVEDAAQSQGASQDGRPMGQHGLLAATSFYPGKNLGAYGDAGAVVSNEAGLADQVRELGNHGSSVRYHHRVSGMNSRLDSLQAIVLRAKLAQLDRWNKLRQQAAALYTELLGDDSRVRLPHPHPSNDHVWHLFVVRVDERDRVLQAMHDHGVGAGVHYPVPVHLQPAFAHLGHGEGAFPSAESSAREILSLPIYPGITEELQVRVVEALRSALAGN